MNTYKSLGPFEKYLDRLPSPGKGDPIDPHVVDRILREIDCVEYSDNFLQFINLYFEEIVMCRDASVWVLSSAIINSSREKPEYKAVVDRLIEGYNESVFLNSINEIDVDSMLYFIGLLVEINKSARFSIAALTANLLAIRTAQETDDIINIISNHRVTLEKVYALPDMDGIKYLLDDAIQALA